MGATQHRQFLSRLRLKREGFQQGRKVPTRRFHMSRFQSGESTSFIYQLILSKGKELTMVEAGRVEEE